MIQMLSPALPPKVLEIKTSKRLVAVKTLLKSAAYETDFTVLNCTRSLNFQVKD